MAKESIHQKLSRVRKPHVHITYDVEKGDAVEVKELPFVVGVMGEFSGSNQPPKSLSERKFVEIDRDNINDVFAKMNAGLNLRVENTLLDDGTEMAVQLNFKSIEDFEPAKIARQVEPLRKLLEAREKLIDLMSAVDRSEKLEQSLEDILKNSEKMQALASELQSKSEPDKGAE